MKAKEKKARQTRRTLKKAFRLFVLTCVSLIAAGWLILHYSDVENFFSRFTVVPVETGEIDTFYDLLSENMPAGKTLVLDLGVRETEALQVAMEKLKNIMGLNNYSIALASHNEEKPPGYINIESKETFGVASNKMTIYLSTHLKTRAEQITTLIHELGHIYVWALPKSPFGAFDQEKLVDTSGIYLGLGVLTLDGMKDEFNVLPDGSYQSEQKTFGYLKPEQFGYLLARFCAEHNVPESDLKGHLNAAGWKYYKFGRDFIHKRSRGASVPEPVQKAQTFIRQYLRMAEEKLSEGWAKLQQMQNSRLSSTR
ncbi:MAG: hypothetical protein HZC17_04725 [Candidatus Omnitrophica bacterium]|nr:hypothetical protein [Candidatus Omnitrophota bacterium]